jgi:hypothetical protein
MEGRGFDYNVVKFYDMLTINRVSRVKCSVSDKSSIDCLEFPLFLYRVHSGVGYTA